MAERLENRLAAYAATWKPWLRNGTGAIAIATAVVYLIVARGAHPDDWRVLGAVAVLLALVGFLILAGRRPDVVRISLSALTAGAFAIGLSQYQPGPGGLAAFNLAVPPGALLLLFLLSEGRDGRASG
jgi:hypothetical protein